MKGASDPSAWQRSEVTVGAPGALALFPLPTFQYDSDGRVSERSTDLRRLAGRARDWTADAGIETSPPLCLLRTAATRLLRFRPSRFPSARGNARRLPIDRVTEEAASGLPQPPPAPRFRSSPYSAGRQGRVSGIVRRGIGLLLGARPTRAANGIAWMGVGTNELVPTPPASASRARGGAEERAPEVQRSELPIRLVRQ